MLVRFIAYNYNAFREEFFMQQKQMIASRDFVIQSQMDPELVEFGFLRDDDGRIFFFRTQGWDIWIQAVLADGTVVPAEELLFPGALIDRVDPGSLGIFGIKYALEGTDVL
jgi:hypothetical protein